MSTQVKVSEIPSCDLCGPEITIPAYADARIPGIGSWANVCKKHFNQYHCTLGTGHGQELVLETQEHL